jgi:hypothetical protein
MKWLEDNWNESLIWCPSQLTRNFEFSDGTKAQAYLRWRWDDPWTASVIPVTQNVSEFWVDLNIPGFKDTELKDAEKWFEEYLPKYEERILESVKANVHYLDCP